MNNIHILFLFFSFFSFRFRFPLFLFDFFTCYFNLFFIFSHCLVYSFFRRKLRRQLGKKVLELGGNAVLGYRQHFDLEGDSAITARGYGTACRIVPYVTKSDSNDSVKSVKLSGSPMKQTVSSSADTFLAYNLPTSNLSHCIRFKMSICRQTFIFLFHLKKFFCSYFIR